MREYVGYFLLGVVVSILGLHRAPRKTEPKPTVH